MNYRLGIDLGISSLGWCCLKTENEETTGILDMGVRVFPNGRNDKSKEPLCVARRNARNARKRLKRFKLRQRRLIADLQEYGLFPTDKSDLKKLEKENPYKLRAKALLAKNLKKENPCELKEKTSLPEDKTQLSLFSETTTPSCEAEDKLPLSPYEIGRVIFHLNQRRGFLSNRKEEKEEFEEEKKDKTFHFNQLQSSLNNKKGKTATPQKAKKLSKTQEAMEELTKLMEEKGCRTLGEYMYRTQKYRFKNPTDTNHKLIIDIYPNRKMYQDEFNLIWEIQKEYYPQLLTDERKKRLWNDIFYQRPLKKQEPGFCSLETSERRCPKAYPIAQEFRIRAELANLKITSPAERNLNPEEHEKLFNYLNNPADSSYDDYTVLSNSKYNDYVVPFEKIIELLELKEDIALNLMENHQKGLLCNITNVVLGSPETLGEYWQKLSENQQEKIIDILQDYSLTKEEIKNKLKDEFKDEIPGLSEEKLTELLKKSLLLPDGYANLSALAMRKLSKDMKRCGTDYSASVQNVYKKTPDQAFPLRNTLPKYQELFSEQLTGADKNKKKKWDYDNYMGRITNVTVHIALNQLRQVVNAIIRKHGKPESIVIELARELPKGTKTLHEWEQEQEKNNRIMEEARTEIRAAGLPITPFNIEKYKVWRNLNPKDATRRVDLYTGKTISISDLFSPEYEIEHILPYSWSHDDSLNNKIITHYRINRQKSNQLPYTFFNDANQLKAVAKNSNQLAQMSLESVKERAKDIDKARGNLKKTFNFNAISWRFSQNAQNTFNKNSKNLKRDLTDTQYMSKLAKRYLTCICPQNKIIPAKGQVTDLLKKVWGITDTLPPDYKLWSVQKWQKEGLIKKEGSKIRKEHPEWDGKEVTKAAKERTQNIDETEIHNTTAVSKDRSIHYHHALDAFTLANITWKMIQHLSSEEFANKAEAYQHKKNMKAENIPVLPAKEDFGKFKVEWNKARDSVYLSGQKPGSPDKEAGLRRIKVENGNSQGFVASGKLQEWNGEKWENIEDVKNLTLKEDNRFFTLSEARVNLLKESISSDKEAGKDYGKPYPNFNKEEFARQLSELVISYKEPQDKLKMILQKAEALHENPARFGFASISKDTAFGFRKIVSITSDDIKIKFAKRKDGKTVYETKSLSCMVPVFRIQEQKNAFHQKYTEWLKMLVRKKKIGEEKYKEAETAFFNTFTKEKAFKWYESDENYAAQIYQISKNDKFSPNKQEDWSLEILSNYYAFERRGKFFWRDTHPTAKLITTLRKNDIVEATFKSDDPLEKGFSYIRSWIKEQFKNKPDKQELKLLFRVKKMSAGNIYLRPLHVAEEDENTKSWICSISKFKQYGCRKVRITPTGRVIGD